MLENGTEIKELLNSISADVLDIDSLEIAEVNEERLVEKLKEVRRVIDETLKYNKPTKLPDGMAWSSSSDNDYEFNSYVFDGSMSLQDHKRAAKLADETAALEKNINIYNQRIEVIDEGLSEPKRSIELGKIMTELENQYGISQISSNAHISPRVMTLYDRASSLRNFDD